MTRTHVISVMSTLAAFVVGSTAQPAEPVQGPCPFELVVSDAFNTTAMRLDGCSGEPIATFWHDGGHWPADVIVGPDGDIYLSRRPTGGGSNNGVLRFDGRTGRYIEVFSKNGPVMVTCPELAFSPGGDGLLLGDNSSIHRHDGRTGEFIERVSVPGGILDELAFGPDGSLYVGLRSNTIRRYSYPELDDLGVFAVTVNEPHGIAFTPDGHLLAALPWEGPGRGQIVRHDRDTGAFIDVFAEHAQLRNPFDLTFGPDGDLYATTRSTWCGVVRFDGTSGEFVGLHASCDDLGGSPGTIALAFVPAFTCLADLTHDGVVSFADMLRVLAEWGPCPDGFCTWDITGDGDVDLHDLNLVLDSWGPCEPDA